MVFPTPVGMDRCLTLKRSSGPSFPHTRGDGPELEDIRAALKKFSPHPWGWTYPDPNYVKCHRVFPTPVGMDRRGAVHYHVLLGFPHTRGDGPVTRAIQGFP